MIGSASAVVIVQACSGLLIALLSDKYIASEIVYYIALLSSTLPIFAVFNKFGSELDLFRADRRIKEKVFKNYKKIRRSIFTRTMILSPIYILFSLVYEINSVLFLIVVLVYSLNAIAQDFLRSLNNFFISGVIEKGLRPLLVILLSASLYSIWKSPSSIVLLSFSLVLISNFYFLRKLIRISLTQHRADEYRNVKILEAQFSTINFLNQVLTITLRNVDLIIIAYFFDLKTLTGYFVLSKIASLIVIPRRVSGLISPIKIGNNKAEDGIKLFNKYAMMGMLSGTVVLPFIFVHIFTNTPHVFEYTTLIMLTGAAASKNFGGSAKLQVMEPKTALCNTLFVMVFVLGLILLSILSSTPWLLLLIRPMVQIIPDFLAVRSFK